MAGPHGAGGSAWRRWLAGWTLRARLIAGLLALFTLASVGVGTITTVALSDHLLRQLDTQVMDAGANLSDSIEHPPPNVPGGGNVGSNACHSSRYSPVARAQAPRTLAARFAFANGPLTFACIVNGRNGQTDLSPARLSAADLAVLKRLPTINRPVSRYLSTLGEYRLVAFLGPEHDVHIAGLPLSGVETTVRTLEVTEVIVFGTALVVMGLLGTGWIRLSLRPLSRVTATAAEVSDLPLESGEVELPHRVPEADSRTEVGRLGRAFNQMLGHVEASLATRQASEEKLRRFIADASHELRTPLAGIRGYTELALRTGGDLTPDVRTALGRVDAESARMSHLVDDLLLLARLDAGRPLAHEQVDLTRLAVEVTSDARVAGPDHKWVLELPAEPVVISGDRLRLHQVLANLLSNARTHTPKGTTVTVRVARTPAGDGRAGAELAVSDDGPGIPADVQEHIWERFARGDAGRSRAAGSTGLGLAIVRAVVTAHRGTVSAQSRPGGTTFLIWLPGDGGVS